MRITKSAVTVDIEATPGVKSEQASEVGPAARYSNPFIYFEVSRKVPDDQRLYVGVPDNSKVGKVSAPSRNSLTDRIVIRAMPIAKYHSADPTRSSDIMSQTRPLC